MSLSKQMILFITSLLLVLLFGTFMLNMNNTKSFLQNQLESHAQDTATSLGLSLSSIADPEDTSSMETMINAVFDRGYYSHITLVDMENHPIYERRTPQKIEGIPQLFIDLISIKAPETEAMVQGGWMPIGKLIVQSHPGYAYIELWKTANNLLIWFILAAFVSVLVVFYTLKMLLKPLKEMEKQAEAIVKKEYLLQDALPATTEFKQVVSAMNAMVTKMKEVFDRDARNAAKLQKMAYQDSVTGMSNRLHFEMLIDTLLDPLEDNVSGTLCLVRINGLKELNDQYGYLIGDKLMKALADEIRSHCVSDKAIHARLNGTEIISVLPGNRGQEILERIEKIATATQQILTQLNAQEASTTTTIALLDYQPGEKRGALLSNLEYALNQADKQGTNQYFYYQPDSTEETQSEIIDHEWQTLLDQAIQQNYFTLFEQSVYAYNQSLQDKELFIRMKDEQGKIHSAGYFMPAVIRLNRVTEIDQLVIKLAFEHLKQHPSSDRLAINLTHSIIRSENLRHWLLENLQQVDARKLAFELPEKIINQAQEAVWPLLQAFKSHHITFGIDHFGGQFGNMNELQNLRPDYIKLDAAFSKAIEKDEQTRSYIQSLCELCESLDIQVIAIAVETASQIEAFHALGVNYFQGYYYGAPQPLSNS